VKRPAGETRGKLAAGPDVRQRHRASPRPYAILICLTEAAASCRFSVWPCLASRLSRWVGGGTRALGFVLPGDLRQTGGPDGEGQAIGQARAARGRPLCLGGHSGYHAESLHKFLGQRNCAIVLL
jgi:hypothetical protein